MPSLTIHIAVGMEYLKNFNIFDKPQFLDGIMAPDLIGRQGKIQRMQSHFSDKFFDNMTLEEVCKAHVNLYSYLSQTEIKNDYDKGYFLHLATDYLFYNKFVFEKIFKKDKSFQTLKNSSDISLYDDYNCVDKHIETKYNVDNSKNPWAGKGKEGEPKYFTKTDLYEFIDICSKIDLKKLKEKVLTDNGNWREEANKFYE